MRDFDTIDKGGEVDDPWYGDMSDFEKCYETLDRCCDNFLHFLVEKHNLKKG
jgi:protein-tyrosine-phosphatase